MKCVEMKHIPPHQLEFYSVSLPSLSLLFCHITILAEVTPHLIEWNLYKTLTENGLIIIYYIIKGVLKEAKRSLHIRREGIEIHTLI